MPVELEVCGHIDFSLCVPDNPQPPVCELGHGFSGDCLKSNDCPDYKMTIAYSLEEVRERLSSKEVKDA